MKFRSSAAGWLAATGLLVSSSWILVGLARPDRHVSTLAISGSSTLAPLAQDLGTRFEARHRGLRVEVQAGGSARGLMDVRTGVSDIGMVSRPLRPEERAEFSVAMAAWDAIALVVHRDNPVSGLSRDQLRNIYTGRLRAWSAVGGADLPITVVHKASGRGTYQVFMDYLGVVPSAIRADVVIGENEQGVKTVAGSPGALAYVSLGTVLEDRERGVPVRVLALDGVLPEAATLREGRYPLRRPLLFVTVRDPGADVRAFLEFAGSPGVREVIEAHGFLAPRS